MSRAEGKTLPKAVTSNMQQRYEEDPTSGCHSLKSSDNDACFDPKSVNKYQSNPNISLKFVIGLSLIFLIISILWPYITIFITHDARNVEQNKTWISLKVWNQTRVPGSIDTKQGGGDKTIHDDIKGEFRYAKDGLSLSVTCIISVPELPAFRVFANQIVELHQNEQQNTFLRVVAFVLSDGFDNITMSLLESQNRHLDTSIEYIPISKVFEKSSRLKIYQNLNIYQFLFLHGSNVELIRVTLRPYILEYLSSSIKYMKSDENMKMDLHENAFCYFDPYLIPLKPFVNSLRSIMKSNDIFIHVTNADDLNSTKRESSISDEVFSGDEKQTANLNQKIFRKDLLRDGILCLRRSQQAQGERIFRNILDYYKVLLLIDNKKSDPLLNNEAYKTRESLFLKQKEIDHVIQWTDSYFLDINHGNLLNQSSTNPRIFYMDNNEYYVTTIHHIIDPVYQNNKNVSMYVKARDKSNKNLQAIPLPFEVMIGKDHQNSGEKDKKSQESLNHFLDLKNSKHILEKMKQNISMEHLGHEIRQCLETYEYHLAKEKGYLLDLIAKMRESLKSDPKKSAYQNFHLTNRFDYFENGIIIPNVARDFYLNNLSDYQRDVIFANPFKTRMKDRFGTRWGRSVSFFSYLHYPFDIEFRYVHRLLKFLYDHNVLQMKDQFPVDSFKSNNTSEHENQILNKKSNPEQVRNQLSQLLVWFKESGSKKLNVEYAFPIIYPSLISSLPGESLSSADSVAYDIYDTKEEIEKRRKKGVNIVGFIRAESGIGETTRSTAISLYSAFRFSSDGGHAYHKPWHISLTNLKVPLYRCNDLTLEKEFDVRIENKNDYVFMLIHIPSDYYERESKKVGKKHSLNDIHTMLGIEDTKLSNRKNDTLHDIKHYRIGVCGCDQHWKKDTLKLLFHEIWTPSRYCLDHFKRLMEGESSFQISRIPPAIHLNHKLLASADQIQDIRKLLYQHDGESFVFLVIFDYFEMEKHNAYLALEAFGEAFGEQDRVMIVMKSINGFYFDRNLLEKQEDLKAQYSPLNIQFLNDVMNREEVLRLIQSSDCLVSLHYHTSFAFSILEAMSLGKPVIATSYSSNMDFMTEQNSFPVRYQQVEGDVEGTFLTEPSVEHASQIMRYVYEHQEEAKQIGQQASQFVRENLNAASVGRKMKKRLEHISTNMIPNKN